MGRPPGRGKQPGVILEVRRQPTEYADLEEVVHGEHEPTVPEVKGDAAHLKQALVELVTNAAEEAGKAGGEMAMDILSPGQATPMEENRVDIFVRNTGSEIPADQLENIFKPFFTTKESDHYGVGLTIAGVLANRWDTNFPIWR